ncbi:hypothetical protein DBV15_09685 [Temnothorax longispinosus]|uniref:Uncharacterized protein n=1 Tax=Temnothorax longispinosus TaxID=300112 RepID=A0A4S2JU89_9HYME|nr:hypothetical protein DBV15_09685 [Temnothorax longispinosus]
MITGILDTEFSGLHDAGGVETAWRKYKLESITTCDMDQFESCMTRRHVKLQLDKYIKARDTMIYAPCIPADLLMRAHGIRYFFLHLDHLQKERKELRSVLYRSRVTRVEYYEVVQKSPQIGKEEVRSQKGVDIVIKTIGRPTVRVGLFICRDEEGRERREERRGPRRVQETKYTGWSD